MELGSYYLFTYLPIHLAVFVRVFLNLYFECEIGLSEIEVGGREKTGRKKERRILVYIFFSFFFFVQKFCLLTYLPVLRGR